MIKLVNELRADVFAQTYDFKPIGLRYFNIFCKRQGPDAAYAAMTPKWTAALLQGDEVFVNGDGEPSSDFCELDNTVQANLLAATIQNPDAVNQIYSIALCDRTSFNDLYKLIVANLIKPRQLPPTILSYRDFRAGDERYSLASISKA